MLVAIFIMTRLLDGKQRLGHKAAKMDLSKIVIRFPSKRLEIIKTQTEEPIRQKINSL
jgi:hypothetical protein